ncbi:hypothetical protein LMH87_009247 [Akanthomyces muscarius]|uniref:Zn(2)-C6 fungal-type domain-containing protein n=1 Tax=Akanthomyces muscarius TaxID=2231603 RepID=A0A9W8QD63_AKAMU|nr:hypothetical protein LMH87_009247 [Akanthomyces muscarius]KAJ4152723.1 hypothetical protein LMH87_009247 [Akanthomyces muscarius]
MIARGPTNITGFSARSREQNKESAALSNPTRKKRWAPKVRTGCATCRNRRIKCDEAKPICRRCITARARCEYPPPPSHKPEPLRPLRMAAPVRQTEPPGWDIAQGARYFVTVMIPDYQNDTPNGFTDGFVNFHISRFNSKPSFLMIVTCHYIATLSAQNGYLVRQGDFPALDNVWRIFYGYMVESITKLNEHIESGDPIRNILYKVIDLLSVELRIIDSPWRAHLNGFLGIVESYGGVDVVMNSSARPPILALQYALIYGIANNACAPVNDQVSGFDSWSDEDARLMYSNTFFPGFPCPSCLFLSIRRITRIRVQSHTWVGKGINSNLNAFASAIAAEVASFSPVTWKESYHIPDEPFLSLLAISFKTATQLKQAKRCPQTAPCQTHTLFRSDIQARCKSKVPLEQERVLGYIENIRRQSGVDCGAATLVGIIPRFWESGKSAWDQCFYKPCQVLS